MYMNIRYSDDELNISGGYLLFILWKLEDIPGQYFSQGHLGFYCPYANEVRGERHNTFFSFRCAANP